MKENQCEIGLELLHSQYKSTSINQLREKSQYYIDSQFPCTAHARVILEEAQRLMYSGSLYYIPMFDDAGHIVVVLDTMQLSETCLLVYPQHPLTVFEAQSRGTNVTNEILNSPWKELGVDC